MSQPEPVIKWLVDALAKLTATQSFALATELSIRNEIVLRSVLAHRVSAATLRRRRTVPGQRRPKYAAVQPDRLLALQHGGREPVVAWHESGHGPALLLLNGWTASGLAWPSAWIQHLEQHYRVIRIDNRGSGWSRSAPRPFTIADLADDARNVLRACGVDRATVLGTSMGGMIAQELAMRHIDVIEKLVLVATRAPTPAHIPSDINPLLILMKRPMRTAALPRFFTKTWEQLAGDGFASQHPGVIAELTEQSICPLTPRSGAVNQARAVMSWHGPSRLQRIDTPTTIVHGNRDRLISVANAIRLHSLIPHADYRELDGVGHLVPQEAGDALLGILFERSHRKSS